MQVGPDEEEDRKLPERPHPVSARLTQRKQRQEEERERGEWRADGNKPRHHGEHEDEEHDRRPELRQTGPAEISVEDVRDAESDRELEPDEALRAEPAEERGEDDVDQPLVIRPRPAGSDVG